MTAVELLAGDCVERMRDLTAGSVDAVVTDPPYALPGGFMGKTWDRHDGREDAALAYYLCGLIDGEGHFAIKQHSRGTHAPAFVLKMRADEEGGIRRIVRDLGFGSITVERRTEGNDMVKWSVQSKEDCQRLVDLLDKYGLRLKKRLDYELWREAVCEWTARPRGNRWHGSTDDGRMADLRKRLMESRAYVEPPWSGHEYQDWCRLWASEALRVLKPGGHLLAFGGTRTSHRLAAGIEDAGFEIRDTIAWMFGSGFPKSLDVSKVIDKAAGAEREVVGEGAARCEFIARGESCPGHGDLNGRYGETVHTAATAPATPEVERWQGWGTALKPAFEPVIVARKPLGRNTVAANVLEYGTGAINVDACRVGFASPEDEAESKEKNRHGDFGTEQGGNEVYGDYSMLAPRENYDPPGRWPANVVLSHTVDCVRVGEGKVKGDGSWSGSTESVGYEGGWDTSDHPRDQRVPQVETVEVWRCSPDCPVRLLDEQTGELVSTMRLGENRGAAYGAESRPPGTPMVGYGDRGGASRFFYCAKTSRAERNAGLDETFEEREGRPLGLSQWDGQTNGSGETMGASSPQRNVHPTVKPIELMRWLLRLVTPPGGVVLDPFLGSGSTGCAAVLEPAVVRFVGIEREDDYLDIARARIGFWQEHGEGALDVVRLRDQSATQRREIADAGQLDLLS